jgi:hypothetical protein
MNAFFSTVMGVLAFTTFLTGTWFLVTNPTAKLLEASADPTVDKELSKYDPDYKKKRDESIQKGCSLIFSALQALFIGLLNTVLEVIVIIGALVGKVGSPVLGYSVGLGWILLLVISLVMSNERAREKKEAEAMGYTYIPNPTPNILRLYGYLPSFYAFYVLLILVGVPLP